MRIVQTATGYYPSMGGAQLHWFTIARLLRDRGHQMVASSEFKRRFRIRDKMVLFLGQKLRYKGFDVLLAAAPLVWAKHPATSFVFIGPHYSSSKQQILGDF